MEVIEAQIDGDKRSRKRAKRPRSAVTSGRKLFVDGDPNSAWARRYHDLAARHASDLGGPGQLSEAQASLIRRAAAIECELELMEGRLSRGESIDIDVFTRSTSHLRRIFETLGVERKPRDVTPRLATYLAQKDPLPMLLEMGRVWTYAAMNNYSKHTRAGLRNNMPLSPLYGPSYA